MPDRAPPPFCFAAPREEIARAILKWMAGERLNGRETGLVTFAAVLNRAVLIEASL